MYHFLIFDKKQTNQKVNYSQLKKCFPYFLCYKAIKLPFHLPLSIFSRPPHLYLCFILAIFSKFPRFFLFPINFPFLILLVDFFQLAYLVIRTFTHSDKIIEIKKANGPQGVHLSAGKTVYTLFLQLQKREMRTHTAKIEESSKKLIWFLDFDTNTSIKLCLSHLSAHLFQQLRKWKCKRDLMRDSHTEINSNIITN